MKRNHMFIALYFVFSVGLLAFTRTVAGSERELMAGEPTTINTTTASTETTKSTETTSRSKTAESGSTGQDRARTTQSTDPIKTTTTTKATGNTPVPEESGNKTKDKKNKPQQ